MESNAYALKMPSQKAKSFKSETDQVLNFIKKHYKKPGELIYPGAIQRALPISITSIYKILFALEQQGLVMHCYQVYCPVCACYYDRVYDHLTTIPEKILCDRCGSKMDNPLMYTAVIFKYRKPSDS